MANCGSVSNFVLIFLCLGVGFWLRVTAKMPDSAPKTLNSFVIQLALPAVILLEIHTIFRESRGHLDASLFLPAAMGWIVFGGAAVLFSILARTYGWSRGTRAALIMTAGLGNTSFVGFPLLEWLVGHQSLSIAILADQLGSFLTLSTVGLLLCAYSSEEGAGFKTVMRRLLTFPPFLALIGALVLIPVEFPPGMVSLLQRLGGTMIPVALVSAGIQARFPRHLLDRHALPLGLGLGYKLVVAPVLIAILYYGVFHARGEVPKVSVLEAAMAPMVSASVMAMEYDCNPELANLMVAVGIPLSLITVPLISMLLP